ncbi:MAG TPA: carbohydrate ABC transporter permease [bacterium]|nr:carbohydrate ABC transporter permease [bacterium]
MNDKSYGVDRKKSPVFFAATRVIVGVTIVGILFPILYIFSLSLRTEDTVYQDTAFLIPKEVTYENYVNAWNLAKVRLNVSFLQMFRNSVVVTVSAIVFSIVFASMASFSFSHYHFRGKEVLFTTLIASYVVPAQVLLIPLFFVMVRLGIINNYLAVILPYIGFSMPIATLILRSFFEQIPFEIKEAAIIDGARDYQILTLVILPLAAPAIASCIILLFLETWNEFIYALVFLQKPAIQTIPVAIAKIAGGKFRLPLGTYGAAIMITIFPIMVVFMAFQKWFVAGVTMGAVKG